MTSGQRLGPRIRLEVGHLPIERRFIRTVVEYLQELTSAKVEHELRVDAEVVAEPEARWVLLPVLRELLAQPDKHTIQPPENIRTVVNLGLEHRDPGHQHGGSLLIEGARDGQRTGLGELTSDGRYSQSHSARAMLVVGDELNHASRSLNDRRSGWSDDFKIDCFCGAWCERANLPC